MVFVAWWMVIALLVAISVCFIAIVTVRWAYRRRSFVRVTFASMASVLAMVVTFAASLMLAGFVGCDTSSRPVYSPNHKTAFRVETTDGGATGGDTSVVIYSQLGLIHHTVFSAGWRSVDSREVEWIDNSRLLIRYDHWIGYEESKDCHSTQDIHVECVAKVSQ